MSKAERNAKETLTLENQSLRKVLADTESELAEIKRQLQETQTRLANISLPPFTY